MIGLMFFILQSQTRNMISTAQFEKMKRGIIIVNTARGGVMDEEALVRAINSGRVLSAGLDVYQNEPNIHPGLVANPHVCLLPHMGTTTVEVSIAHSERFKTHEGGAKYLPRQKLKWKNGTSRMLDQPWKGGN
jgi:lactate dehydrogenase-like 2-hydroxyacid dehydrogenase